MIFHFIMLSLSHSNITKENTTTWLRPIFFYTIDALPPLIDVQLYQRCIALSRDGLQYMEAMNICVYKLPTHYWSQYYNGGPLNLIFIAQFSHPLPRYNCVFSGVVLNQIFIGWLLKMVKTFGSFYLFNAPNWCISNLLCWIKLGINLVFPWNRSNIPTHTNYCEYGKGDGVHNFANGIY